MKNWKNWTPDDYIYDPAPPRAWDKKSYRNILLAVREWELMRHEMERGNKYSPDRLPINPHHLLRSKYPQESKLGYWLAYGRKIGNYRIWTVKQSQDRIWKLKMYIAEAKKLYGETWRDWEDWNAEPEGVQA